MGVAELNKPRDVRCNHLTSLGRCGIYADRPESCAAFKCLWLQGSFPVELKPNKIQAVPMPANMGKIQALNVDPKAGRVWEHGVLAAYIERMRKDGTPTLILYGEERIVVGIPDGYETDTAFFMNEVSIDGTESKLVQLAKRPRKRGQEPEDTLPLDQVDFQIPGMEDPY